MRTPEPHQGPIEVFRACPEIVPELVRDLLGIELPPHGGVTVLAEDYTEIAATRERAEHVVVLTDDSPAPRPVMGIIVEYLNKVDPRRRRKWPRYIEALHKNLGCPVSLLVYTDAEEVGAWAAQPIEVAGGGTARPMVITPDRIPWIRSPSLAEENPALAVLSAMAHSHEPGGMEVTLAAFVGSMGLSDEFAEEPLEPARAEGTEAGAMTLSSQAAAAFPKRRAPFESVHQAEWDALYADDRKIDLLSAAWWRALTLPPTDAVSPAGN